MSFRNENIAIWALTSSGAHLGRELQTHFPGSRLFLGSKTAHQEGAHRFDRLADALPRQFARFDGHIFIMAAGIVVRSLAPLIDHKTTDPAVVVVDECGRHAISLLAGHLGGANALARRVGDGIGARPVITTATDLRKVPAIDLIAQAKGLIIENPSAIRHVSMALLEGRRVRLYDPQGWLDGALPGEGFQAFTPSESSDDDGPNRLGPGVWVDDIRIDLPDEILVLRPPSLFVGVGCNRNTPWEEIQDLLHRVLNGYHLAAASIAGLASIDLKADEEGLLTLAQSLSRPLVFFSRDQLATVREIATPSKVVQKHVGVESVCEAAAILASGNGTLIAPKQVTPNATIAIARQSFIS